MNKTLITFSNELLDKSRLQQDPVADQLVSNLIESGYNLHQSDAYNSLEYNHQPIPKELPKELVAYFENIRSQDIDQEIHRNAQQFFKSNASEILLCLGYLSLPYCYAAANGSKVLSFSERIYANPEKRLLETASFVFDVCSPNAFKKGGKGFISIGKVRLMHAAVRYYLLKSNKWNMDWGAPINQEDMAGTNLSFSLIVLRGLKKLSIQVSSTEWITYIKYWNFIGSLLGVTPDLLPESSKQAYQLDFRIRKREFTYSESGSMLANSLLNYLKNQKSPIPIDSESLLYFLLGREICDYLGFNYNKTNRINVSPVQIFSRFKEFSKLLTGQGSDYHSLITQLEREINSESRFKFLNSLNN